MGKLPRQLSQYFAYGLSFRRFSEQCVHEHHAAHARWTAEGLGWELRHVREDSDRAREKPAHPAQEGARRHREIEGIYSFLRDLCKFAEAGGVEAEYHRQDGGGRFNREASARPTVRVPVSRVGVSATAGIGVRKGQLRLFWEEGGLSVHEAQFGR